MVEKHTRERKDKKGVERERAKRRGDWYELDVAYTKASDTQENDCLRSGLVSS